MSDSESDDIEYPALKIVPYIRGNYLSIIGSLEDCNGRRLCAGVAGTEFRERRRRLWRVGRHTWQLGCWRMRAKRTKATAK